MKNTVVRLLWCSLENFKNVGYGKIEMPGYIFREDRLSDAEILGIYGQNGSGKTAVIDAMSFLSDALCGRAIKKEAADYITESENEARLKFAFSVECGEETNYAEYAFSIRRTDGGREIGGESLSFADFSDGRPKNKRLYIKWDADGDEIFSPAAALRRILSADRGAEVELKVAKLLSQKEGTSFFFSEGVGDILSAPLEDGRAHMISALSDFAKNSLFVIKTTKNEDFVLPVSVRTEPVNANSTAKLLIEPALIETTALDSFIQTVKRLNRVLDTLIPGLSLDVEIYGEQMMMCGVRGTKIELVSVRNGRRIPIKYESEGIRKIISVLNIMIAMYNDRSVCMVVDELDAGIYEYLLGELLSILDESGSGQLIFTSHNLRPLEMIDRSSIIFTTTNPDNRYIRLGGPKNANLRDLYLRTISLGGEREEIYDLKNSFEISHAMRQAQSDDE